MTSKSRIRFDPYTLRELAGDRIFARGEAYFLDGTVEVIGIEPSRVVARVAGTEDYRTVVTGQATAIGGECSCPAFERDGFCKHMVAVALAANADVTGDGTGGGPLAQIKDYLKTRDVDALVEMIMGLVERDAVQFQKLKIAAASHSADDETLEPQLRKAILDATRTRGFVDYGRAGGWAAGVDAALDMLEPIAGGPRAALAITLAGYAIARIERAIENIDDSDGHCTELLARAQRVHLAACLTAKPDPVPLARDLFQRETEGDYETFDAAAARYAEVLGEEGLGEYRRLAQEAWDGLSGRTGRRREVDDEGPDGFRLAPILDFFAERDGDLETRIALRSRDLSSPWAYFQLAEFCQRHGRGDEALRRAEEGLWLFEDERPDEQLVFLAVNLLLEQGRKADAEAHLWRAFEKAPNLRLHARLREVGGDAAVRRAVSHLRGVLANVSATRWQFPADLVIRIMIEEKMIEDAWCVVRDHGASQSVKEALADASDATYASQALAVYAERVEDLARGGGNPAYEAAAALIDRMSALRGGAEQAAYLAGLKERHARKRNFMKLLE